MRGARAAAWASIPGQASQHRTPRNESGRQMGGRSVAGGERRTYGAIGVVRIFQYVGSDAAHFAETTLCAGRNEYRSVWLPLR